MFWFQIFQESSLAKLKKRKQNKHKQRILSTKSRKNSEIFEEKVVSRKKSFILGGKATFLTIFNPAKLKKHRQTKKLTTVTPPWRFHGKFTQKVISRKNSNKKIFTAEKATILALFHGRHSGILWGRLSPVLLSGPGLGRALLHHRQLQLMGLVQPGVECWGLLSTRSR